MRNTKISGNYTTQLEINNGSKKKSQKKLEKFFEINENENKSIQKTSGFQYISTYKCRSVKPVLINNNKKGEDQLKHFKTTLRRKTQTTLILFLK